MTDHRGSRRAALASAVVANFGQFGARVAISPFVLAIAATFTTSKGVIGLVLTVMWAAYALWQFPSGVLADRYGERRVILVALTLSVVGSVLVALAPSLPIFALAALVLGSGAGMYFAAGTALLDRRYTNTGMAFGLHGSGGPLAGLIIPIVAAWVGTQAGWRAGVLVGGVGALLALLIALVALDVAPPNSPDARIRDRLRPTTIIELLSRPTVAFSTFLGVTGMYAFQSFVSFFPTFLQEYHELSRGTASFATGIAFLLVACGLPTVGRAADRFDMDASLVFPYSVAALGFGVLLVVPTSAPELWVGVVLVGVGLTWGGAVQARLMRGFAEHERGTGFGLGRSVYTLLGSVGNVVTGALAGMAGWPAAYGVIIGLCSLSAVLIVTNRVLDLGL